jgi:hypothetical protein
MVTRECPHKKFTSTLLGYVNVCLFVELMWKLIYELIFVVFWKGVRQNTLHNS